MTPKRPYSDPRWRRARAFVLERDRYACQLRLEGCKGKADRVDHVKSWKQGGDPFNPANLLAACNACNIRKRYAGDRLPCPVGDPNCTNPMPHSRHW